MPVGIGEVDEVDGGDPGLLERRVVVLNAPAHPPRKRPDRARPLGARAQELPQRRVGARLARDRQVLVAHEVHQDHGRELACVRLGVGAAAAHAVAQEVVGPAGALLAVEEHEADLAVAGAAPGAQGPGELEHRGRARRPVVGAHEARDVLGVVVRPHQDRLAAAREAADHVAQAAGHALEMPARDLAAQPLGQEPRRGRPRRPRPQLHLGAQVAEGALGVEPVARAGRAAAAAAGGERDREGQGGDRPGAPGHGRDGARRQRVTPESSTRPAALTKA